jgi:hypothetical protein
VDVQLTRFGLNGATGEYLPAPAASYFAELAAHDRPDRPHMADVKARLVTAEPSLGVVDAVEDVTDLAQAGWGVIFAADIDPAVRRALADLLARRREQATRTNPVFYKEYEYHPGETKHSFLRDRDIPPAAAADPEQMPYYLLLVGSPRQIPFSFQYQLDVQYAVGRIDFDSADQYLTYARGVLEAESSSPRRRAAAFFAPQNPEDAATELSARLLAAPLADRAVARQAKNAANASWQVLRFGADRATKPRLLELLGSAKGPALVFTASHGLAFPSDHPRQRTDQGSIVCQEWPGPAFHGELQRQFYVSGHDLDVAQDMQPLGLIAFHFACYSAGTPRLDDYPQFARQSAASASLVGARRAEAIALNPFVASLPRRLLAHPGGGALAVVGHVERALGASFIMSNGESAPRPPTAFDDALGRMMRGVPVGAAMEGFNQLYAEHAADLSAMLRAIEQDGEEPNPPELAREWVATADARGYVILGDPAVRLSDLQPADRASVHSNGSEQP